MRRFPVKKLAITLHILAKLTGCKTDLLEIVVVLLLVKAEEALVSLKEGNGSSTVDLDLE